MCDLVCGAAAAAAAAAAANAADYVNSSGLKSLDALTLQSSLELINDFFHNRLLSFFKVVQMIIFELQSNTVSLGK